MKFRLYTFHIQQFKLLQNFENATFSFMSMVKLSKYRLEFLPIVQISAALKGMDEK